MHLNNSNKKQQFNSNNSRHRHLAVKHKYDFHALSKQSPKKNPIATLFYIFLKSPQSTHRTIRRPGPPPDTPSRRWPRRPRRGRGSRRQGGGEASCRSRALLDRQSGREPREPFSSTVSLTTLCLLDISWAAFLLFAPSPCRGSTGGQILLEISTKFRYK